MNIDQQTITIKLKRLLTFTQIHALFLGIVGFSIVYGYIITRISSLTTAEPEQTKVTEQLKRVPRPKIDVEAARIIEGLESENINVKAIFNEARENPFSE